MTGNKRILILGDSLPLHRPDEGVQYEQTYGQILKDKLEPKGYSVFVMGKRRNDTTIQSMEENLIYDMSQFKPGVVILHFGIVHCAPRLFSRNEYQLVNGLPGTIKNAIVSTASKRRRFLTKRFPKVYVTQEKFEKNMDIIIKEIISIGAIPLIINIARPPEDVRRRSHNFLENVNAYNKVLSKLAAQHGLKIVDFFSATEKHPEYLVSDGIHVSKPGNIVLADMLAEALGHGKD